MHVITGTNSEVMERIGERTPRQWGGGGGGGGRGWDEGGVGSIPKSDKFFFSFSFFKPHKNHAPLF